MTVLPLNGSCLFPCLQEKDKGTRLAYVAAPIPRRLASTSDIDEKENRWSPEAEWLCTNMHWHERHLLPTAVCCRQHNALHGVCGPKKLPLARLLCCTAVDLVLLEKRVDLITHICYLCQYLFMEAWGTIVACGSPGTLLLWYVVAHIPGDAGMMTWRTAKEAPPPTEPPATSAG